ncbi:MAG: cysteine--tRNA ligase [Candidatus Daviesbacteria bacterium]|nr:cysteine--tRNA ligase [Candidatus Daviesbacteria bacterium]
MSLRLFNTLSRKIEEFKPLNPPKVGIYACGPTVYDFIHLGNLRSFIFYDLLRRTLTANNFEVQFVENITDIEDKIIKRALEKDITPEELTKEYTKYFNQDTNQLNILTPNVQPKATEHIGKMIKYIEKLLEKGLAYQEKDGSVYFDISKFLNYGKLSGLQNRELKTGTRILSDEYSKDDAQDFALWKAVESDEYGWDSPWGKGRPGWHIECSVMSQEYLGDTFDIHTGGIDLIFPHHENEIAQAEGHSGQKFVNYFVHAEHLLVDGKKMSKSLNNFYTLRDIEERGFEPLAFRYLTLTAHYRDKLNFTWESLEAAQQALNNIREEIRGWELPVGPEERPKEPVAQFWQKFLEAASYDLNMPQAVAVMHQLLRLDTPTASKSATILKMDQILGLNLDQYLGKTLEISDDVQKLLTIREKARNNQDFKEADKLRVEIKKLGYEIEDNPTGPKLKKL